MIARTKKFLGEVRAELGKASWPWDPKEKGFKRYKELYDSTVVVVIGMIFLGAFVSFTDLVLASVTGATTRAGYESRKEAAAALVEQTTAVKKTEESERAPVTSDNVASKADADATAEQPSSSNEMPKTNNPASRAPGDTATKQNSQ